MLADANGFKGAIAGNALGQGVAANTSLKELDLSSGQYNFQSCSTVFAQEFAVGLGAINNLLMFSGNDSRSKPVTMQMNMVVADFSNKALQAAGTIMLASYLSKCE